MAGQESKQKGSTKPGEWRGEEDHSTQQVGREEALHGVTLVMGWVSIGRAGDRVSYAESGQAGRRRDRVH